MGLHARGTVITIILRPGLGRHLINGGARDGHSNVRCSERGFVSRHFYCGIAGSVTQSPSLSYLYNSCPLCPKNNHFLPPQHIQRLKSPPHLNAHHHPRTYLIGYPQRHHHPKQNALHPHSSQIKFEPIH